MNLLLIPTFCLTFLVSATKHLTKQLKEQIVHFSSLFECIVHHDVKGIVPWAWFCHHCSYSQETERDDSLRSFHSVPRILPLTFTVSLSSLFKLPCKHHTDTNFCLLGDSKFYQVSSKINSPPQECARVYVYIWGKEMDRTTIPIHFKSKGICEPALSNSISV